MWYYSVNGQQFGPVEEAAIRELYAGRTLSTKTMVWKEGTPQWISIRDAFPEIPTHLTTEEQALTWVAPVNTSWTAIIAGYLGLFSFLIFPAPFALLFGILAIRDLKANPAQAGWGRAIFGVVTGGGICLLGFLGFLFAILAG
ncbi:MAG: DUF4339 domain-containing protein [Planctomycetia bacterium]|nr:DUF4339 domain-containing protein [Planctomycetia bacterium]